MHTLLWGIGCVASEVLLLYTYACALERTDRHHSVDYHNTDCAKS